MGNNKAPKVMSEEAYLGEKGLAFIVDDYMLDKMRLPHGETQRQYKRRTNESISSSNEYHKKRQAAIAEYQTAIAKGEILPPTNIERAIIKARGHEDNAATQAARRVLAKKGIDWKTGKKFPDTTSKINRKNEVMKSNKQKTASTKALRPNPFKSSNDIYLTKNKIAVTRVCNTRTARGYEQTKKVKYYAKNNSNIKLLKAAQGDIVRVGRTGNTYKKI